MLLAASVALAGGAWAQESLPPIEPLWTIPLPAATDRFYLGRHIVNGAFLPEGGFVLLAEEKVSWRVSRYSVMISNDAGTLGTWTPVELQTPLLVSTEFTDIAVGAGGEIYLAGVSLQGLALLPIPGLAGVAVFVVKLAPDGAVVWERSFFQDVVEGAPEDLAVLPSGGVAISGDKRSSGETYLGSISAEGEWEWERAIGIVRGESSVSAFPDGRILLVTMAAPPFPAGVDADHVLASTFRSDGSQIDATSVRPGVMASYYRRSFLAGLALAEGAYVVFDGDSSDSRGDRLAAAKLDEAGITTWRTDPLTDFGLPWDARCSRELASNDRSLILSCAGDMRTLTFIDKTSGASRTFSIPRPACQAFADSQLIVAPAADDELFLLSLGGMPAMGRRPNCVWLARVETD